MGFERALLTWALAAVFFSLLIGGKPWRFPRGGEPWLKHALRAGQ